MKPVTIVSAFVSNANNREAHRNGDYLRNGRLLLKSTTPKIVFLDEAMFSQITEADYNPENTKIVVFEKTQLYYMQYLGNIANNVITDHPGKDTKEYLMVIWNKTEFMKEAVLLNTFNTEHFVWVDFGIRYVCAKYNDGEFVDILNGLRHPTNAPQNKVRIGGIWNPTRTYNIDVINTVCWFFAGGVFGGNAEPLLRFSEEMRTVCNELITQLKSATWEVNVWYIIYTKHPELFDIYPSSHNETLIDGYTSDIPVTYFM